MVCWVNVTSSNSHFLPRYCWLPALDWELVPQNLRAEGSALCSTFRHPSWQPGDSGADPEPTFSHEKMLFKDSLWLQEVFKITSTLTSNKAQKNTFISILTFSNKQPSEPESQERSHLCLWPSVLTLCSVISRCSTLSYVVYVPVWSCLAYVFTIGLWTAPEKVLKDMEA